MSGITAKLTLIGLCGGAAIGGLNGALTRASGITILMGTLLSSVIGMFAAAACRDKKLEPLHMWIVAGGTLLFGIIIGVMFAPFVTSMFSTPVGMVAGSWLALLTVSQLTRKPQYELGHCPNCGYDLRGIPNNRCPECGEPFIYRKVFGHDRIPQ